MAKTDDAGLAALAIGTAVVGFAGLLALIFGLMDLIYLGFEGVWMILLGLGFCGSCLSRH